MLDKRLAAVSVVLVMVFVVITLYYVIDLIFGYYKKIDKFSNNEDLTSQLPTRVGLTDQTPFFSWIQSFWSPLPLIAMRTDKCSQLKDSDGRHGVYSEDADTCMASTIEPKTPPGADVRPPSVVSAAPSTGTAAPSVGANEAPGFEHDLESEFESDFESDALIAGSEFDLSDTVFQTNPNPVRTHVTGTCKKLITTLLTETVSKPTMDTSPTKWSVSFDIKLHKLGNGTILTKGGGNFVTMVSLFKNVSGTLHAKIRILLNTSGTKVNVVMQEPLIVNQWHRVTFVVDEDQIGYLLDGVHMGTSVLRGIPMSVNGSLTMRKSDVYSLRQVSWCPDKALTSSESIQL